MGSFGGFYKGDKKKPKKSILEKKAEHLSGQNTFVLPKIEIVGKRRKDKEA